MIESIQFKNFRALRDTTLPLSPFTLIVGPNGSGKSTALKAIQAAANPNQFTFDKLATAGLEKDGHVEVLIKWGGAFPDHLTTLTWNQHGSFAPPTPHYPNIKFPEWKQAFLRGVRIFSLEPDAIAASVQLRPNVELGPNGANLAGVLDGLRDSNPERFEALNNELGKWLPEFDRILFDTPQPGQRAIVLRTRDSGHKIPAADLSHGTLIALAILTLAYIPNPPSMVCLEEPDRGLHPRLLRDVRDAIYRLAYPESCGESRPAVQVIATTHSPYFLDLFRDHPEEIVIAEKAGMEGRFQRLSDRADLSEILGDAHLGEVWYSGILGGVPTGK